MDFIPRHQLESKHVLELGSGTGLVATVVNCILHNARFVVSDYLPVILKTLVANLNENKNNKKNKFTANDDSKTCVMLLDWFHADSTSSCWCHESDCSMPPQFDTILAADVVYDMDHAEIVPKVVSKYLASEGTFYCVLPLRPNYNGDVDVFEQSMRDEDLWCYGSVDIWQWEQDIIKRDEKPNEEGLCRQGSWYRFYQYGFHAQLN
jgi:predicted nicotinamide N-methyase